MLCSLSNMNAVTALVLALAVGVAHCELQHLLKQSDEDLYFSESLQVDSDKLSDTSFDYNSLKTSKENYGNGHEGSKEEYIKRIATRKPTNRVISIYDFTNAVVIPRRSPKSNLNRSYLHNTEHTSNEGDSNEISEEDDDDDDYDNAEVESTKYEGSGRPHFSWDMEGSGNEYGSGEVGGSGDNYVEQEDYGDSIDLFDDADLQEFIQNEELFFPKSLLLDPNKQTDKSDDYNSLETSKEAYKNGFEGSKGEDINRIDNPKPINDTNNAVVIPSRSQKSNLDHSYLHSSEHISDEEYSNDIREEDNDGDDDDYDDRKEGSAKYGVNGRHHFDWEMEGSGNEYGSGEVDGSGGNYVEQEDYGEGIDSWDESGFEEFKQNEELFFPESLLVDPDKQTGTSLDYNSLEAPREDYENGFEGSKEEDINSLDNPRPINRVFSTNDPTNAVVIPSRTPKSNLDHRYLHNNEHIRDEENGNEISEEDNDSDDYYDRKEGGAKYGGNGRHHFDLDMEGSGNEYGSGEVDGSGDNYLGQEDYGEGIDSWDEAGFEEFKQNEELFFPESLLVDPAKQTEKSDDYESLEASKGDDDNGYEGSREEYINRIDNLKHINRVISINDRTNAVVIPNRSTKSHLDHSYLNSSEHIRDEEDNNEINKEDDDGDDYDDREEGGAKYGRNGRHPYNLDVEGSGDEYGSGEVDGSGDNYVGQEDYGEGIDSWAEAGLEEFRQNEDLFFPESLLVDPDKNTEISDDYNSLEAPKEDGGDGLGKPKEEDVNRIAKPKPANRVISIYDIAKSPKSTLDQSYFHSSEHISDEEDSSKTSEEYSSETSEEYSSEKSEEYSSEISKEDEYYYDDSEEGSTEYEGSGRPHFNWDIEGSSEEYGSGEVDGSGDYYVGKEDNGDSNDFLAEADLEDFIPMKTGNLSTDIDSQIDVEYDEEEDIPIYSPPQIVIHGYGGSPIGEMAKLDFLENEMHQVKGQISQLSARMEQQSNDIGHLQRIIIQLQEQINTLIYRQYHLKD